MPFDPDDPRLTAYALGELEDNEKSELETLLAESAEGRQFVDEIRATAKLLSETLGEEAVPGLNKHQYQAIESRLAAPVPALLWYRWTGYGMAASLLLAVGISGAVIVIQPMREHSMELAQATPFFSKGVHADSENLGDQWQFGPVPSEPMNRPAASGFGLEPLPRPQTGEPRQPAQLGRLDGVPVEDGNQFDEPAVASAPQSGVIDAMTERLDSSVPNGKASRAALGFGPRATPPPPNAKTYAYYEQGQKPVSELSKSKNFSSPSSASSATPAPPAIRARVRGEEVAGNEPVQLGRNLNQANGSDNRAAGASMKGLGGGMAGMGSNAVTNSTANHYALEPPATGRYADPYDANRPLRSGVANNQTNLAANARAEGESRQYSTATKDQINKGKNAYVAAQNDQARQLKELSDGMNVAMGNNSRGMAPAGRPASPQKPSGDASKSGNAALSTTQDGEAFRRNVQEGQKPAAGAVATGKDKLEPAADHAFVDAITADLGKQTVATGVNQKPNGDSRKMPAKNEALFAALDKETDLASPAVAEQKLARAEQALDRLQKLSKKAATSEKDVKQAVQDVAEAKLALKAMKETPKLLGENKPGNSLETAPAPAPSQNAGNTAKMTAEQKEAIEKFSHKVDAKEFQLGYEKAASDLMQLKQQAAKDKGSVPAGAIENAEKNLAVAKIAVDEFRKSDETPKIQAQDESQKRSDATAEGLVQKPAQEVALAVVEQERLAEEAQAPNEAYDKVQDNAFESSVAKPLSTFSTDVDTASYANIRRFLNDNSRPPKGAVRIEEMINYFPYNYEAPAPTSDVPFSINLEVARCPWNADHQLARIGLKGKPAVKVGSDGKIVAARPTSNLVFLVDVSGSMNEPNKLPLVKSSLMMLTEQLGENDHVAIVVYAGNEGLALQSTSGMHRAEIRSAIDQLDSGGSTNGGAGITLAYKIAVETFIKSGVNRVILCTDGDFNVGVTDRGELIKMIEEKRKSGVFLSVLGFGQGNLKDATMEQLADKGNGSYGYIDSLDEARKVFVKEMDGTLVTIAKDVKVQVDFNAARVASYRLIGYENRALADKDFADDTKDAGEIGAGTTVTALYELVPAGKDQPDAAPVTRYARGRAGDASNPEMFNVALRYKAPDGDVSKLIERSVKMDSVKDYASASPDFKFAASVAAFGMILRDSPHKGNASLAAVAEWADASKGDDKEGYRKEFVELVRKAGMLISPAK